MKKSILVLVLCALCFFARSQASFYTYTPTVSVAANSCLGTQVFQMNVIQVDAGFSCAGEVLVQKICTAGVLSSISFTVPTYCTYARGTASVYQGSGIVVPGYVTQSQVSPGQVTVWYVPKTTANCFIYFTFLYH